MKWRILAVLYALNLFCGNGYAREISPDGEVSREQLGKDYVYFPYRDCVVFTVRSVFKNSKGRIVLLGAVNHVLRGKLKVRSHESMEFESRDCDLNFEELKNTKNRTWVIAFNGGFWRQSREDPLPVQCLSFKSSGKPLSKESIREWESKLSKTHFHYCSGWLVTMLDEAKPSLRAHERVLKLRIDEILVENQRNQALDLGVETPYAKWSHDYFRAGEIVQCRLPEEFVEQLPASPAIGRKAVLFFNFCKNKEGIDMANVTSPFPHQVFNEADLAILRTQIAQQKSRFSELQCKLQSSMEQFWTEARLKRFCRPENVYVPFSAALKLGFNSELFMSGNLFPNRPELGKIRWYVTFWDGEPDYYQLDVWKDSSYWRISSHVPDLNRTGDKGLLDQSKRSISE